MRWKWLGEGIGGGGSGYMHYYYFDFLFVFEFGVVWSVLSLIGIRERNLLLSRDNGLA